MKISNFRNYTKTGSGLAGLIYRAQVDVTTGILWWKKTEARDVCRAPTYWFWAETGRYCPGLEVECLERAYEAKNGALS